MRGRVPALSLIVALFISGCSSQTQSTASPTPSPFTAGNVTWTSCGGGFLCGTLQVPLDYAHPGAGTIGIALNRKPATNQSRRIGSLLINPGGPGGSGIDFIVGSAPAFAFLNQQFDLVGFDPRGVGRSAPVRCLDGPGMDAFLAIDGVLDDPAEKAAGVQANKDFVAGCSQLSAKVLPFVDTISVAKDMDLIRMALGDDKLTYLGFSYGTYLGEMYAHLFPTHIRALVLDAVIDPTLSAIDMDLTQVASFEKNLQAFLTDCNARKSATPKCEYAQSGDPASKLDALMQRLDTSPLPVGNRMLTRALAQIGVSLAMYDQSFWPDLDKALTQVDQGKGTLLLNLTDRYTARQPNGTYKNELEANTAINCLDHPAPTDLSAYDQLASAFAQASPFFGSSVQYASLPCAYWPAKPTGHPGPLTAKGAPPILLVGGTNDPATPYAWAVAAHQQLEGSVLVTRNGNGHTSYAVSLCATLAEIRYLNYLTVPADGTVCPN